MAGTYTGPVSTIELDHKPSTLIHVVYDLDTSTGPVIQGMTRTDVDLTGKPKGWSEAFARKVARGEAPMTMQRGRFMADSQDLPKPSPWDIHIAKGTGQCNVLIQLNPKIKNWFFKPGGYGVDVKLAFDEFDNINLKHFYETTGDMEPVGNTIAKDKICRVLMFSVYSRGEASTQAAHSYFNVATVFDLGTGPTDGVFDPDVPNDGDPFP